jgi:hypothetical protein
MLMHLAPLNRRYIATRPNLSVDKYNHSHRFEDLKSHEMSVVCVTLATAYTPNI